MFHDRGKPMIVAETGATTDQAEYLRGIARRKAEGISPRSRRSSTSTRPETSTGGSGRTDATGLAAFAELGRRPYFATMPAP